MRRLLLLALAAASACSHPPRSPAVARQANCRPDYISDSAVAGLPIGASVASVKAHCRVLEDTTFPGLEGLPERTVVMRHGVRAAINPVVTVLGVDIGVLLGSSVLVETVFNIPGIGRLNYVAITHADFPIVQGTVLFAALVIILANIIVDIAYAFLDPRVRY